MEKKKDLIFEIGTEELPISIQKEAEEQMPEVFKDLADEVSLPFEELHTFIGPRRIALFVKGIPEKIKEKESFFIGPKKEIAFKDGVPTKVAEGFAKKHGIMPHQLKILKTEDGERIAVQKRSDEKETKEVLQELLPSILKKLSFSKKMFWEHTRFPFPRPIRWILALFGEEVLRFNIASVSADRYTRGHRVYKEEVFLENASFYKERLRDARVIVCQKERKEFIKEEIERIASSLLLSPKFSEESLERISSLIEWPYVLVGEYPHFLLPEEVIEECIKALDFIPLYMCLEGKEKKLSSYFLFISNVEDKQGHIKRGNERVLSARLEDAEFYMKQDRKKDFRKRLDELKEMVWIKGLGTLYDKTMRLLKLSRYICDVLNEEIPCMEEAAIYSKCDLSTQLVGEYPHLQGKASVFYANDLSKDAIEAIATHYLPETPQDPIPPTLCARILSVAERVDTICGTFIAGTIPKGSSDPYGIRKVTNGLLRIFFEDEKIGRYIELKDLINECIKILQKGEDIRKDIFEFLHVRAKIFLFQNWPQDYVEALMQNVLPNTWEVKEKLHALSFNKEQTNRISIIYKRLHNICEAAQIADVNEALFEKEEERKLWRLYKNAKERYFESINKNAWIEALKILDSFFEPLDEFFQKVMVMVPEPELRKNRLSLLSSIKELFFIFCDFSKIKVS